MVLLLEAVIDQISRRQQLVLIVAADLPNHVAGGTAACKGVAQAKLRLVGGVVRLTNLLLLALFRDMRCAAEHAPVTVNFVSGRKLIGADGLLVEFGEVLLTRKCIGRLLPTGTQSAMDTRRIGPAPGRPIAVGRVVRDGQSCYDARSPAANRCPVPADCD